jgi:hypothetical protein
VSHFAKKTKNRVEAAQVELRHFVDNIVEDAAERIEEDLNRGIDWTESKIAGLQRALDAGRKFIQGRDRENPVELGANAHKSRLRNRIALN